MLCSVVKHAGSGRAQKKCRGMSRVFYIFTKNIASHRKLTAQLVFSVVILLLNPLTPASNCPRPTPNFLAFFGNMSERVKAQK